MDLSPDVQEFVVLVARELGLARVAKARQSLIALCCAAMLACGLALRMFKQATGTMTITVQVQIVTAPAQADSDDSRKAHRRNSSPPEAATDCDAVESALAESGRRVLRTEVVRDNCDLALWRFRTDSASYRSSYGRPGGCGGPHGGETANVR